MAYEYRCQRIVPSGNDHTIVSKDKVLRCIFRWVLIIVQVVGPWWDVTLPFLLELRSGSIGIFFMSDR